MQYLTHVLRRRPRRLLLGLFAVGLLLGSAPARGQSSVTGGEVPCEDGSAAGYPCENVDLLSFLSISDLGGGPNAFVNDVWGWTDPQTGIEYVLVGRSDGLAFVDVSTPTDPVYVGELPTHSEASLWRDAKVYENHVFVVSEASNHGMQVFDLTQLRTVAADERPVTFSATARYGRIRTAHNVVVNPETGYAYVVGASAPDDTTTTCGGGLHMVNIQEPTAPTFTGCFSDPSTGRAGTGYTHDAQCVRYQGPDQDYQGDEVCFNANETALNIANVSNKDAPTTITNVTYPNLGYTHQAWLTEDHRYLFVDDELDERLSAIDRTRTLVFDVADLDNPTLAHTYSGPTESIDHNQYITDSYAYQANYTSGLRLLDVADPTQPEEAAFFDTYPSGDGTVFEGAWGTYPFFDSNVVPVSSIGEGLFLLQPNPPPILSFTGLSQKQDAVFRWSVSATARTKRIEIEHKPPRAHTWKLVETLPGRSGTGVQSYEYSLNDLAPGIHQVRVRHVSEEETVHTSGAEEVRILPTEPFAATGPAPNPARTQARFGITLRETQDLRIALYDVMGRRVRLLYDGPVQKGVDRQFWIQADRRAAGTYFLRVEGESIQLLRKVVVAR